MTIGLLNRVALLACWLTAACALRNGKLRLDVRAFNPSIALYTKNGSEVGIVIVARRQFTVEVIGRSRILTNSIVVCKSTLETVFGGKQVACSRWAPFREQLVYCPVTAQNASKYYRGPEDPHVFTWPGAPEGVVGAVITHAPLWRGPAWTIPLPPKDKLEGRCSVEGAMMQQHLTLLPGGANSLQLAPAPLSQVQAFPLLLQPQLPNVKMGAFQKNWMPFVYNNTLLFIFSLEPLIVVQTTPDGTATEFSCSRWEYMRQGLAFLMHPALHAHKNASIKLHGGPPVVAVTQRSRGSAYYLGILHYHEQRVYYHHAFKMTMEPPFRIYAVSTALPLTVRIKKLPLRHRVNFVAGLLYNPTNDTIVISYGVDDHNGWLMEMSSDELEVFFASSGLNRDLGNIDPAKTACVKPKVAVR